jgi:hypothetical protein
MLNRREFMTVALAALPAPAIWAVSDAAPGLATDPSVLYTVVYDDRFHESITFAGQARRLGYRTRAISGDTTDLWYNDLYHRWKKGPAPIAGLTTPEAAMCLKLFGADAGLRCVFETQHRFREGQSVVEHSIRASSECSSLTALQESGDRWPEHMLRLMRTCRIGPARQRCSAVSKLSRERTDGDARLVSWLLAPIQRNRVWS